jgi:hypothetical protein
MKKLLVLFVFVAFMGVTAAPAFAITETNRVVLADKKDDEPKKKKEDKKKKNTECTEKKSECCDSKKKCDDKK